MVEVLVCSRIRHRACKDDTSRRELQDEIRFKFQDQKDTYTPMNNPSKDSLSICRCNAQFQAKIWHTDGKKQIWQFLLIKLLIVKRLESMLTQNHELDLVRIGKLLTRNVLRTQQGTKLYYGFQTIVMVIQQLQLNLVLS